MNFTSFQRKARFFRNEGWNRWKGVQGKLSIFVEINSQKPSCVKKLSLASKFFKFFQSLGPRRLKIQTTSLIPSLLYGIPLQSNCSKACAEISLHNWEMWLCCRWWSLCISSWNTWNRGNHHEVFIIISFASWRHLQKVWGELNDVITINASANKSKMCLHWLLTLLTLTLDSSSFINDWLPIISKYWK